MEDNMGERIAFNLESNGYAPAEVNAYVELLLENYEELLGHYETRVAEIQALSKEVECLKLIASQASAPPPPPPVSTPKIMPDYNLEALELLNETTTVVAQARAKAKTQITAMVDQTAIHIHRLEGALETMKGDLEKMHAVIGERL